MEVQGGEFYGWSGRTPNLLKILNPDKTQFLNILGHIASASQSVTCHNFIISTFNKQSAREVVTLLNGPMWHIGKVIALQQSRVGVCSIAGVSSNICDIFPQVYYAINITSHPKQIWES